jgi:succinyl-CoA synthetase beta subunit
MKIHEYQGKEILRQFGVPVPRGIPAFTVQEAVEAAQKLGGPVWVVKAQIHAGGRGKGGGVKVAKTIDDVKRLAEEILGMQLKTHQTGPEGQKVRRLYIEDGADINKEYYVSVVTDRATQKIAFIASSEGGMDIEEVAHSTPEKIITEFIDPLTGLGDAQAKKIADAIGMPADSTAQAVDIFKKSLPVLHGNRRVVGGNQPSEPRQQRQRDGLRREVQLRRQRFVPSPRNRGLPRLGRRRSC